jgi:hypothetical protein
MLAGNIVRGTIHASHKQDPQFDPQNLSLTHSHTHTHTYTHTHTHTKPYNTLLAENCKCQYKPNGTPFL